MTATTPRDLTCARCGAAFTCGTGGHDRCWCAEESFRVPMPTVATEDCLCPACLRSFAQSLQAEVRS